MFENKLASLLQKYLGDFVYGLEDKDALRVSVFRGQIELKNLKLRPEALKFLGIPGLTVRAGLLGCLTLRIPWNKLGSEPVIVEFDRIYALGSLDASGKGSLYDDAEQAEEASAAAKKRRIEAAVSQMIAAADKADATAKDAGKDEGSGGYFNRIIQTVLGNLQVIITNLHVRLEDPYWGFAIDFTIEELSGVTVNDKGEPDFVSSGLNEQLRKKFKLRKLQLYMDPNAEEMTSETPWEDLSVNKWDDLFMPHITGESEELQKTFFLKPVNADLLYNRKVGKAEVGDEGEIIQTISLNFEELGITALQSQYMTIQRMLQTFEVVSARAPYSHIRPHCSVKTSPRAWWHYAVNALFNSGLVRKRITLNNLVGWNSKREAYVKAYIARLRQENTEEPLSSGPTSDIMEEMEAELNEKTIVFFRCLAIGEHKRRKLERIKSSKGSGGGWLFGWGSSKKVTTEEEEEEEDNVNFDSEDWQKLQSIYMKDSEGDATEDSPKGMMDGDIFVEVNVVSTSLQLFQSPEKEILQGSINEMKVQANFIEGLLGITAYVGSYLLESKGFEIMKNGLVSSEAKAFTLTVEQKQVYDLHLTHIQANIAPCFVQVYRPSLEDILVYFSAHDKGATRLTTLGMQASAAAQEIGKNTAEQLQSAIASRPRLTFSLDLQAPKVAVVWGEAENAKSLVVNLGRIVLSSEDSKDETVWQRMRVKLSDTEVYLADGELQWKSVDINKFTDCMSIDLPKSALLPKFGMEILFQYGDLSAQESQLSLDLHVPDFSLHFSPMLVYDAMNLTHYYMTLSSILDSGENSFENAELADVVQIAISSEAAGTNEILSQKLGNKRPNSLTMNWIHSCKVYLKDDFLYADIPGNAVSKSIFLGRASQILAVPSKFVDDRENVIIVTESNDRLKQALNMDSSIVISFDDVGRKGIWLQTLQSRNEHLRGYAQRTADFGDEFLRQGTEVEEPKSVSVHIHGKLDIFHLFVNGRAYSAVQQGDSADSREETELVQVNAKGVSVDLSTSKDGMHLQATLNSLFIEDLLLGRSAGHCRYLVESESERMSEIQSNVAPDTEKLGMIDQEGDVFYDPDESTPVGSPMNQAFHVGQGRTSLATIRFDSSFDEVEGAKSALDIDLSLISIYVNRPTIAALMMIGQDMGYFLAGSSEGAETGERSEDIETEVLALDTDDDSEAVQSTFVFNLRMKEAKFILSYESIEMPLALLKVESLALSISLAGERFLLEASLGNLKVADCSVESTHMYHWAVDVYEGGSGSGSLVNLSLGSVENDGSELCPDMFIEAHMNSISVVFLNRFLMEILLYIENLFKYQPQPLGSVTAPQALVQDAKPLLLKLDVALGAPMIKLPRSTASTDYLELTPGEVKVSNRFWIDKFGKDVNIDEMDILLTGIKCTAYMDGRKGKDNILDGSVIQVILSRPLNFAADADNRVGVKVLSSEVKGKLSEHEYHFVISVAGENFSEEMKFKSDFQLPLPADEVVLAEQDSAELQLKGVAIDVGIDNVDLILYTEDGVRLPLSTLQCMHLKTCLLFDFADGAMDLSVNLPQVRVKDISGGDEAKHFVVLCSGSAASSLKSSDSVNPSLLNMKFRSKGLHSELDLQLQEPRIFGEIEFIMNILDFFVPTTIPEDVLQCTTISDQEYKAECDVFLSPATRICAMSADSDVFVYDGNGFSLIFPEKVSESRKTPLIYVGTNKTLLIKNTVIVNYSQMSTYTEMMANAKIEFEGVTHADVTPSMSRTGSQASLNEETDMKLSIQAYNFLLELRASTTDTSLSAQGNVDLSMHMAGKSQHLRSKLEGLCLYLQERSTMTVGSGADVNPARNSTITLLEPCAIGVEFVVEEASDMIHVDVSNLSFQLSPMAIHFLLQLQEELITSLGRATPDKPSAEVVSYTKLFSYEMFPGTILTFWRPLCDSKYAIMGDCISFGQDPPQKYVSVVAKGYGMVKKPLRFKSVFCDESIQIWHPVAPPGYVSLGCIITEAHEVPDLEDVSCINQSLCFPTLTEEYFSPVSSSISLVNVRNDFGTFIVLSAEHDCACLNALIPCEMIEKIPQPLQIQAAEPSGLGEEQQDLYMDRKISRLEKDSQKPYLRYTVQFERILQNRRGNYSFWRPIAPDDCYSLGDVAMKGLAPPSKVLCIHRSAGDKIANPTKFSLVRMEGQLSIWKPIAPQGYVALGCILSKGTDAPPIETTCCVKEANAKRPELFDLVELKFSREVLFLFTFNCSEKTFIVSDSNVLPNDSWAVDFGGAESEEEDKSMIVTTKCGNICLTISDSVQTPKFEVRLVDILVSMEGKAKKSSLMCTFGVSLSSYNSALLAWEPVLEKTEFILKIKMAASEFGSISLPGSLGIYISPTTPIRITVAHACLESTIFLLSEWSDMTKSGSLFMNQDLNCLHTNVTNETGSSFFFLLRYSDGSQKVEMVKSSLERQEFLRPFNVPKHMKNGEITDPDNDYIRVRVVSLHGSLESEPNELFTVSATLEYGKEKVSSYIHTRAFDGFSDSVFNCNEMLLIPLPQAVKDLLLGQKMTEGDILNVSIHLWKTHRTESETRKLVAAISYPIMKGSSHQIREESYRFSFIAEGASQKPLFVAFGLDLPLRKIAATQKKSAESETFIGATADGPWTPLSKIKPVETSRVEQLSSIGSAGTISPLRVGAGCIIMESNLAAGKRLERFRSNVQVFNSSQIPYDVGVKKIIPTDLNVFEVESDHDPVDGKYFVSVFENERFNIAEGWGVPLGKGKRTKYSTFYGKSLSSKDFPNLGLPLGWEWCGDWKPRKVPNVDKSGWCYFKNFDNFQYPPPKGAKSKGMLDSVRARCFVRYCKHTTLTDEEIAVISAENNSIIDIGTVGPRDQIVVPKKFCAVGSILELVWRPSDCLPNGEKIYNWSILVSARSEHVLSLGSMEETSQLMACAHNMIEDVDSETEPAMFCVSSEGIELSSYIDTVTDWKIAISPAISIENCTNVDAQVNLWEDQKAYRGGLPALKCKEQLTSHSIMDNIKVDPRKNLSMTFVPEGWSWVKGKNAMELEDGDSQSKEGGETRSTRFSLSRDSNTLVLHMRRTRVYPRFSFPFTVKIWAEHCIENQTQLPLSFTVIPENGDFEELRSTAFRVITADESGKQASSSNRNVVMPGKSELMSSLKGSGKSGLLLAISESCWSSESIPLVPGADVILVKAFCPYSSKVFHVTLSVHMHELAPTTVVCCKPHIVCSNLTGKEILVSGGEKRESSATKIEIDGREIEIHSADRDKMRLAVRVPGYLWSECFDVTYPNGANVSLTLESEDLQCARILTIKTKLESPGCLHIFFTSFNLIQYAPPYSIVNFFSESIMCKKAYDPGAEWVEVESYTSFIPRFMHKGASGNGVMSIEVKAKDAPARVYTLWTESTNGKDFSMDDVDEDSDLQLDAKQAADSRPTKLHPLPINSFPGECSAQLVRKSRQSVKLVISEIFKMEEGEDRETIYFTPAHTEFKFDFKAEYVDISVVNSLPREVMLLTLKGLRFSLCDGIGMHNEKVITCLELQEIELDDMLPITPYPAAITCKKSGKPLLSLVLHQFKRNHQRIHVSYSELCVGRAVEVEIYEKFLWEIMDFVQSISLEKLESRQDTYADPDMQVDVMSVTGLNAHITFQTDAQSRPKSLPVVSKFGLNFANIERLPISVLKRWEVRNLKLKQSVFMRVLASRISRDFSKQILPMLLSGLSLNTVSNVTTGAISSIANAAAVLSLDDKFETSRSKKTGPVDDLADGLVSGGESLAKGLVSGISGIFTKPIQGAKKEGAKGFAKGFAKGIIGVATKPISGALDMVSKSVEGGLATIDGVKSITEVTKTRLRYPRAFQGDKVLKPYNAYTAQGQHIFRTSVVAANLEELELTRELNPFTDDVYEHHEPLPSDRVLVITDQRVMSMIMRKGRLEGAKIAWHAHFLDILSVEIVDSTAENPRILRVILSANMGKKFTFQEQKFQREVHCFPKQNQARRLEQVIQRKRQQYTEALNKPDILLSLPEEPEAQDDAAEGSISRECSDFEMVWHSGDYGSPSGAVSIWRARCPAGFYSLGDVVSYGMESPHGHTLVGRDCNYQNGPWMAKPVSFRLEWRDTKKGRSSPAAFWIPVPPEGYVAVGCVVQTGNTEPHKDCVRCVRKDLVYETSTYDSPCWHGEAGDKSRWPLSLWQVDNNLNTFVATRSKTKDGLVCYDLLS